MVYTNPQCTCGTATTPAAAHQGTATGCGPQTGRQDRGWLFSRTGTPGRGQIKSTNHAQPVQKPKTVAMQVSGGTSILQYAPPQQPCHPATPTLQFLAPCYIHCNHQWHALAKWQKRQAPIYTRNSTQLPPFTHHSAGCSLQPVVTTSTAHCQVVKPNHHTKDSTQSILLTRCANSE